MQVMSWLSVLRKKAWMSCGVACRADPAPCSQHPCFPIEPLRQVLLALLIDHGSDITSKGADQMTCEEMLIARHHQVSCSIQSVAGPDICCGLLADWHDSSNETTGVYSHLFRIWWIIAKRCHTIKSNLRLTKKCTTSHTPSTRRAHGLERFRICMVLVSMGCHANTWMMPTEVV